MCIHTREHVLQKENVFHLSTPLGSQWQRMTAAVLSTLQSFQFQRIIWLLWRFTSPAFKNIFGIFGGDFVLGSQFPWNYRKAWPGLAPVACLPLYRTQKKNNISCFQSFGGGSFHGPWPSRVQGAVLRFPLCLPSKKIDYIHKIFLAEYSYVIIGRRLHRNILEKYLYVSAM